MAVLVSSPDLFFSLNVTKETNGRMDERARKIGLIHTAEVVVRKLPRIWVIIYFAVYYSANYIASTSCNGVSIVFSHQPGYLFLDNNLGEVDSNQQQVLDRFSVVLASSITVRSLCTFRDCSLFTIVRL